MNDQFQLSTKLIKEYEKYALPVIGFEPTVIKTAKDLVLTDIDNNNIIDFSAGQFCSVLGNSLNDILDHLKNKPLHTNTATLSEDTLYALRNLNIIADGMDSKSILLNTGAEAIEFAIRYSKKSLAKNGILCFNKGYHGLTLGAQSITYGGVYASPLQNDIFSVPVPSIGSSIKELDDYIVKVEEICRKNSSSISCMVFEPIVSVGGMYTPDKYYFENIREICDRYEIILIFDECQTGFGRTGTWFYYQQLGVIPDILVTAKAIGLGFPVSVVSIKNDIVDKYGMKLTHYSSHQNDPLSGAVINFGIDFIKKNNILKSVRDKGYYLFEQLDFLSSNTKKLSRPRGKGLIVGADLLFSGINDYRSISIEIRRKLLKEGILIQATNGGQTLRFLPAFIIQKWHIDLLVEKLNFILNEF